MSHSKLINIEQIGDLIPSGSLIAIGGVHSHNVPMSIVRQIVRAEIKDLTILGSISVGLPIDMLVAMGCVKKVLAPYVGFEMWGLAPNFRKAVESGQIEAPDVCEAFPIYSLRAAANGMLFQPFPPGIHEYTSVPSQSDLYKKVEDPYTGEAVYALAAIHPDVAIIHVQKATPSGLGIHLGSVVTDWLMASAAKTVILSCDELINEEEVQQDPSRVTIPAFLVDYVLHLPNSAHPTSSHGMYGYDEQEIKAYLKASKDPDAFMEFIDARLSISEQEYLATFAGKKEDEPKVHVTDKEYTISELISCVFARDIKDNEVGICGAVSEIPMAAMQLAERLHAPSLKWIAGGSGYVNPRDYLVPSSTDFHMSKGAETRLSMNEVMAYEMEKIDFFFAGGLQIDKMGNANLAGIPSENGWKLRGPGSVGLPFLNRAGRIYYYTLSHNTRTLVDTVAYISGPGYNPDANYSGNPALLVTNLCVFAWNKDKTMWELVSLHPGVSLDDVKQNTGFEFIHGPDVPQTQPPSTKELEMLRSIDKYGILRRY